MWLARSERLTRRADQPGRRGAAWLHLRSFEWVFGRKSEEWLQHTTAGLLTRAGCSMRLSPATADAVRQARRTGVETVVDPARGRPLVCAPF